LLGAYASLQPGEQVEWQPSLSTFFPDATSEGKPKGLKKFMEEVKQIQQVLEGKILEADDNQTEAQLIDLPDGVGNANHLSLQPEAAGSCTKESSCRIWGFPTA
jgi:hypothetical protein